MNTNTNEQYLDVIKTSKFITKADEWYIENTEAKFTGEPYLKWNDNDKFNKNCGVFIGEIDVEGNKILDKGESHFNEFLIYDKDGLEISELTLKEYLNAKK